MPQSAQAREIVGFAGNYSSGTIVVTTNERALYYVLGNGKALRYPVGVGPAGKQWTGMHDQRASGGWCRRRLAAPRCLRSGGAEHPMARRMTLSGGEHAIHLISPARSAFRVPRLIRMYTDVDQQPVR